MTNPAWPLEDCQIWMWIRPASTAAKVQHHRRYVAALSVEMGAPSEGQHRQGVAHVKRALPMLSLGMPSHPYGMSRDVLLECLTL